LIRLRSSSRPVNFVDELPADNTGYFTVFNDDLSFAKRPGYVSIRSITRNAWKYWSSEIEDHYFRIAAFFADNNRFWWLVDAHRFHFLPSESQTNIKLLLFCRAVKNWDKSKTVSEPTDKTPALSIVGAPDSARFHLSESDPDNTNSLVRSSTVVCKELVKWCKTLAKNAAIYKHSLHLIRHHVFQKRPRLSFYNLIVFSEAIDSSPSTGFDYYYGAIHPIIDTTIPRSIKVCTTPIPHSLFEKEEPSKQTGYIYLLDFLTASNLVRSLLLTHYLTLKVCIRYLIYWFGKSDTSREKYLLLDFVLQQVRPTSIFENFCVYFAAKDLLQQTGTKQVLLQYEEKSREKALIMAGHQFKVDVVGYAVHPMGFAFSALKDCNHFDRPCPDHYAVCGSSMLEFLSEWGNKPTKQIVVWGSGKTGQLSPLKITKFGLPMRVLLLPSYTLEVDVFYNWILSKEYFHEYFEFFVKNNPLNRSEQWVKCLDSIKNRFDFVHEFSGKLGEAFQLADLAIYSSTSAGLLAGRYGTIGILADLADLYQVNSCLHEAPPLICRSSDDLVKTIRRLCACDTRELEEIYNQQHQFESKLFSPISEVNIRNTFVS
jgi:hypothetical protein